jgi:hypothetical protein
VVHEIAEPRVHAFSSGRSAICLSCRRGLQPLALFVSAQAWRDGVLTKVCCIRAARLTGGLGLWPVRVFYRYLARSVAVSNKVRYSLIYLEVLGGIVG